MRTFTHSEAPSRRRLVPIATAALLLSSLPILAREVPRARIDERIREINARLKREGAAWRAGRTSAFAPSEEELRALFPPIPPIAEEVREKTPIIRATGAESFPLVWDWREMGGVTPVKHQFRPHDCDTCFRSCGSCYAFAACAQLESFIKIYDAREENLSEQQILSCRCEPHAPSGPGGCYGGNATLAYNTFLDPGAVAETCMVYEADHEIPCAEHECAVHGRISGWSVVASDVSSLKLALLSGPVWINMYSCNDFKFFYRGGSYTYAPGVAGVPNHAMLCVGWNDTLTVCDSTGCRTIGSWIIKNSWGTGWGYGGYGYIQYGTPTFADEACQIHYTPSPVTRLYLREPDGGQVWASGSQHKILWHNGGLSADRLEIGWYSRGAYRLIDGDVDPDAGEFLWTVSGDALGECRASVAARGPHGELLGGDESDSTFTVIEPRTAWDGAGVAVCGTPSPQEMPAIASDNLGGAIVVWLDTRSGVEDIFAQRLDAGGNAIWPASGVGVNEAVASHKWGIQAAADGSGGAFVIWTNTPYSAPEGESGTDILARHIGANGIPLGNDIILCDAMKTQQRPHVAPDNSGGAYVAWEDMRNADSDIYALRIDRTGSSAWEPWNGVPICTAAGAQMRPRAAADRDGDAIIAWIDRRSGAECIYAQRILPNGSIAWRTDGIFVCRAPGTLLSFEIISDWRGGAIFAWLDHRSGAGPELRAQRILPDGSLPWGEDGAAVCPAALDPHGMAIAPDGSGGLIAAWDDARGTWIGQVYRPVDNIRFVESQRDIYAQRVTAGGALAWGAEGLAIASLPRTQETPLITFDGAGGAIIAWSDKRDSRWLDAGDGKIPADENNFDIFAQRVDSSGAIMWHPNGEPLCADVSGQLHVALTQEHGPAVYVAWDDSRTAGSRVYIQKIAGNYSARRCAIEATVRRNGASFPVSGVCLSSCPAGDSHDTLNIVCDFIDGDMADVPCVMPSDIELVTDGLGFSFHDSPAAGMPGTADNGYAVSLVRRHIAGCGGCPGGDCTLAGGTPQRMLVRHSGASLGYIEGLRVRSIDARGDGAVNALTNDGMGSCYGSRASECTFKPCYDFDVNGVIDAFDLAALAAHYGHARPADVSAASHPATQQRSDVALRFVMKPTGGPWGAGKLSVAVSAENAYGLSSLAFALDNVSSRFTLREWTPAPGRSSFFPITMAVREGCPILFFACYRLSNLDGDSIEIGTMTFDIAAGDTTSAGSLEESWGDDFHIVFADFVDVNGRMGSIAGVTYREAPLDRENRLYGCHPNPFNPKTTIAYSIKERCLVTVRIYTVAGQLVKTLVSRLQDPRISGYEIEWDGRNAGGGVVSSGIYFCRMTAGNFTETKKLVLLR